MPLIAYLLGSIPFGFLIVKARGRRDIRESGSGNIGAANVARTAGAAAGLFTLLFDAGKGFLAVWIAAKWTAGDMRWMMAAAVFAVLGHIFTVWLEFRGGKGVATLSAHSSRYARKPLPPPPCSGCSSPFSGVTPR